ncbi:MAG: LysR family transcriptional regulator, partial [Cloacibacillus sp.]|nr:LysR family transcriptional regulator [Cloacibacillus sp.]
MEIREFEYILSVIRNRSFSASAADLHIYQHALSKYVASLEQRLG